MGSDSILAGIGATVLAVTLLVCGFAACCLPVTTASLAGAVSTGADSPYTHEQLVSLAQETRAFTVDAHSSMEEARESLAADVVAAAREASAEGAPKYSQWTQKAKQVLGDVEGEGGTALETMDALAKVSDRYALDADAVSHLEDCNGLITGLSSYLGMIGVAALIIALVLGFRKQFAALAFMLRMGSALLLAVLVVLGFCRFQRPVRRLPLAVLRGRHLDVQLRLAAHLHVPDRLLDGHGGGLGRLGHRRRAALLRRRLPVRVEGPGAAPRAGRGRRSRGRPLQETRQEGPAVMARAPKDHKTNALRELDAAGIPHEELFFDAVATMTGEEIARAQGEDPDAVFKTLVTQGKSGGYYVVLVPVAAELDLKKAAAAAGEKAIAMIKARELLPLTGYVHGGCSPIGMKKRFPTFVDETAQLFDTIHFSGGKVGCQIRMNPDDLARLIPFQYADLTV